MGSGEGGNEGDPSLRLKNGSARDDVNVLNDFNVWGNLPVMPLEICTTPFCL